LKTKNIKTEYIVRRIFVEKKADFAIKARELKEEMSAYLGIDVEGVRVLMRYDIENLSDETYEKAKMTVFSEPPVDDIYEENFPQREDDFVFTVEYLPGQFDQRADSAEQCVTLLNPAEQPIIRSATTYVISGSLTDVQRQAVVKNCVNPVDSRVTDAPKPETLVEHYDEPADVKIFDGFKEICSFDIWCTLNDQSIVEGICNEQKG
jgi:phosphoribosylformylglycinamidine synthase